MEIPVYGLSGIGDIEEVQEFSGLFKKIKGKIKNTGLTKTQIATATAKKKAAANSTQKKGSWSQFAANLNQIAQNAKNQTNTIVKAAKANASAKPPTYIGTSAIKAFSKIANPAVKKAAITKHVNTMRGLEGIFNVSAQKIGAGTGTATDAANLKKARVLITLADTDYDAFRLASIYMPYVTDIDENDGGYIFPTQELADVAAAGEEEFIAYAESPQATELGKIKLFKKIKNAVSNAAKSVGNAVKTTVKTVANTTKAAVKSTVNAVKATANVVKAGAQAVTGHGSAAKATLKKAGQQAKSAVVDPIKQAAKDTKAMVSDTIVNPIKTAVKDIIDITKETVKLMGKVFKVLFLKINPVTVMIRSSWRGLMAINFLAMASRLAVGLMTQSAAEKEGYTKEVWQKAVTAVNKAKKLFKKMGGNPDKLEKSIRNGSKRKPLFKKDINGSTKVKFVNGDDGDTTLGDPATVAAMIAACVGILTSLWSWVKGIVNERKQKKEQEKQQEQYEQQRQYNQEHYECDVNGNPIVDQYGRPIPKGQIEADMAAAQQAAQQAAMASGEAPAETKSNKGLWIALIAAAGVGAIALMSNKKGKRR